MAKKAIDLSFIEIKAVIKEKTVVKEVSKKHAERTLALCAKGLGSWELVSDKLQFNIENGITVKGDSGAVQGTT